MKQVMAILVLTIFGVITGAAQTGSSEDYKPAEIFVGYSFSKAKVTQYDRDFRLLTNTALGTTFRKRDNFAKGFTAAGVVNIARSFGVKADFSLNFNNRPGRLNNRSFTVKERLATYTLGIQIKDNKSEGGSRLRPFAHILAGFANTKSTLKDCAAFGPTCPNSLNKNRYGTVVIGGAGLDVKLSPKVTFRAIQVDYMTGKTIRGWRFSSGVVF